MTLATTHSRNGPYDTEGAITDFAYTFRVDDEADLIVYKFDTTELTYEALVLNSDYTVTGVGSDSGGNVAIPGPIASGFTITILRVVTESQTFNAPQSGAWSPEAYEDALDNLQMQIQQNAEIIVRCVKEAPWVSPLLSDPASYLAAIQAGAAAAPILSANSVITVHIQDNAVDKDKINADIASDGLRQRSSGALAVDFDNVTLDVSSNKLRIKPLGVDTAQLKDQSVTGAKLDVNVVGGGLQISGDALAVIFADKTAQEAAIFTGSAVAPGTQHYHPSAAKAWVVFGGVAEEIKADHNITSVADNGTGDFTFTFTENMSSGEYCAVSDIDLTDANPAIGIVEVVNPLVGGFDVNCWQTHDVTPSPKTPAVLFNPKRVRVAIFGDM